jgi:hypothetical protein
MQVWCYFLSLNREAVIEIGVRRLYRYPPSPGSSSLSGGEFTNLAALTALFQNYSEYFRLDSGLPRTCLRSVRTAIRDTSIGGKRDGHQEIRKIGL